jgi:hypothetical protein
MRPIALNALFAGHDLGAENWAVLASLIETCKLHGVNPEAWLADVLTKLVDNRTTASPNSPPGPGKPPAITSTAPLRKRAAEAAEITPSTIKQAKNRCPRSPAYSPPKAP